MKAKNLDKKNELLAKFVDKSGIQFPVDFSDNEMLPNPREGSTRQKRRVYKGDAAKKVEDVIISPSDDSEFIVSGHATK